MYFISPVKVSEKHSKVSVDVLVVIVVYADTRFREFLRPSRVFDQKWGRKSHDTVP